MLTKSSWSTSLKVRQEKTDLDAGKEEDGDAIVDSNDVMEEEFAEERRLLCSPSEPSQLARQVHTARKTRMSRILELILVTLLRVYQS